LRLYSKSQKYNKIYLFIKYIKNVLWRVAERLSYVEDACCLKVKVETWQAPEQFFGHQKISSDRDSNFGPFNP